MHLFSGPLYRTGHEARSGRAPSPIPVPRFTNSRGTNTISHHDMAATRGFRVQEGSDQVSEQTFA